MIMVKEGAKEPYFGEGCDTKGNFPSLSHM